MAYSLTDFRRIRVLFPGPLGLGRGKYISSDAAVEGAGFCAGAFGVSYDRELLDAPGAGLLDGLGDVRAQIDLDSLRPSWEDDATGVASVDLTADGELFEVSSRAALKKSVNRWVEAGYTAKVGIELEGYLVQPTEDGSWERYKNPRSFVYGTGVLGDPSGYLDAVMAMADKVGFNVESSNIEFDESQFEFTLRYDDAVRATDDAFLFRIMAREVAIQMGLDFVFLGLPFPGVAGSGLHINVSLIDQHGKNALYDESEEYGFSALGRQCIAGMNAHHQGLTPLLAPTINAYRRLQPGTLTGCWANWGVDHRSVANRIPAEAGMAMRIENRLGDGAMSVHLGVAAILEAARLGVIDQLDPGPPYEGDGFEEGGDVKRSATSLSEALVHLTEDSALVEALGEELIGNFVVYKTYEVEKFEKSGDSITGDELSDFEREMYLPYH